MQAQYSPDCLVHKFRMKTDTASNTCSLHKPDNAETAPTGSVTEYRGRCKQQDGMNDCKFHRDSYEPICKVTSSKV